METNDSTTGQIGRKLYPCDHCAMLTKFRCSGTIDPDVCEHPCCVQCAERSNDCPYRGKPLLNETKHGRANTPEQTKFLLRVAAGAAPDQAPPKAALIEPSCSNCGTVTRQCICLAAAGAERRGGPNPPPPPATGFKKDDSGKLQMGLVAPHFVKGLADALTFGAKKYGRGNYLKGAEWSRYIDAALRHFYAWLCGEENDEESGIGHLYHCAACLLILSESARLSRGTDDRKEVTG